MKYRNFTSWPLGPYTNDGRNIVIPPQAMTTEVNPQIQKVQVFRNAGLFADDCRFGCGDMPSKLAANGKVTGKDIFGAITSGFTFWASNQQAKADAEAAAKAAEIERLRLQQEAQRTKQEEQKVGIAKAYAIPLVIGGVIVAGIAAYFIFKKKKV